jgi:hypothetical protein
MKKFILGLTALAAAIPAVPATAVAQGYYDRDGYYESGRDYRREARRERREARRYARYYDNRGYYSGPTWRGNDGRYYCHRSDGSTGLVIGAVGGALVGRSIDTRGDRAAGTLLGAALGALVGSAIDKDSGRRCR